MHQFEFIIVIIKDSKFRLVFPLEISFIVFPLGILLSTTDGWLIMQEDFAAFSTVVLPIIADIHAPWDAAAWDAAQELLPVF